MKKIQYFSFVILILLIGSPKLSDIYAQDNSRESMNQFYKENVVLADARVRSLSQNNFVKEVVLISFSNNKKLLPTIIFDGTAFTDDGSYNDLNSGDGVYTSVAQFKHSIVVPFSRLNQSLSVMEDILIDNSFLHKENLKQKFLMKYIKPGKGSNNDFRDSDIEAFGITIECDIEFGTCGCLADRLDLCSCCCHTYSNCKVSFGLGWGN